MPTSSQALQIIRKPPEDPLLSDIQLPLPFASARQPLSVPVVAVRDVSTAISSPKNDALHAVPFPPETATNGTQPEALGCEGFQMVGPSGMSARLLCGDRIRAKFASMSTDGCMNVHRKGIDRLKPLPSIYSDGNETKTLVSSIRSSVDQDSKQQPDRVAILQQKSPIEVHGMAIGKKKRGFAALPNSWTISEGNADDEEHTEEPTRNSPTSFTSDVSYCASEESFFTWLLHEDTEKVTAAKDDGLPMPTSVRSLRKEVKSDSPSTFYQQDQLPPIGQLWNENRDNVDIPTDVTKPWAENMDNVTQSITRNSKSTQHDSNMELLLTDSSCKPKTAPISTCTERKSEQTASTKMSSSPNLNKVQQEPDHEALEVQPAKLQTQRKDVSLYWSPVKSLPSETSETWKLFKALGRSKRKDPNKIRNAIIRALTRSSSEIKGDSSSEFSGRLQKSANGSNSNLTPDQTFEQQVQRVERSRHSRVDMSADLRHTPCKIPRQLVRPVVRPCIFDMSIRHGKALDLTGALAIDGKPIPNLRYLQNRWWTSGLDINNVPRYGNATSFNREVRYVDRTERGLPSPPLSVKRVFKSQTVSDKAAVDECYPHNKGQQLPLRKCSNPFPSPTELPLSLHKYPYGNLDIIREEPPNSPEVGMEHFTRVEDCSDNKSSFQDSIYDQADRSPNIFIHEETTGYTNTTEVNAEGMKPKMHFENIKGKIGEPTYSMGESFWQPKRSPYAPTVTQRMQRARCIEIDEIKRWNESAIPDDTSRLSETFKAGFPPRTSLTGWAATLPELVYVDYQEVIPVERNTPPPPKMPVKYNERQPIWGRFHGNEQAKPFKKEANKVQKQKSTTYNAKKEKLKKRTDKLRNMKNRMKETGKDRKDPPSVELFEELAIDHGKDEIQGDSREHHRESISKALLQKLPEDDKVVTLEAIGYLRSASAAEDKAMSLEASESRNTNRHDNTASSCFELSAEKPESELDSSFQKGTSLVENEYVSEDNLEKDCDKLKIQKSGSHTTVTSNVLTESYVGEDGGFITESESRPSVLPSPTHSQSADSDKSDTEIKSDPNIRYGLFQVKRSRAVTMRKTMPALQPDKMCFTCPFTGCTHGEIKEVLEQKAGFEIKSLQFDPIYMQNETSGTTKKSRWILELQPGSSRSELLMTGFSMRGARIDVRNLDDVHREEVQAYEVYDKLCTQQCQQKKCAALGFSKKRYSGYSRTKKVPVKA